MYSALTQTQRGSQFAGIDNDLWSKLTPTIPKLKTLPAQVACIFLNHCIIQYGISDNLSSDSGRRSVSTLLISVCKDLAVQKIMTKVYHKQPIGQVNWLRHDAFITTLTVLRHEATKLGYIRPIVALRFQLIDPLLQQYLLSFPYA